MSRKFPLLQPRKFRRLRRTSERAAAAGRDDTHKKANAAINNVVLLRYNQYNNIILHQISTVGQYTFEVSAKTRHYMIGLYR